MKYLALILCPALFCCWLWLCGKPKGKHTEAETSPTQVQMVAFRTKGGSLQTNGFTKTEIFKKSKGSFLGTTASEIRLDATYRYEIELRSNWNIYIDDKRNLAFVIAPALRPQLPVAVDSKSVYEATSSGWGRFNKWGQLQDLRKETSLQLKELAQSPAYMEASRVKARVTVEEFVIDWLLKNRSWPHDVKPFVKVYFADDQDIEFPEKTCLKDFLP